MGLEKGEEEQENEFGLSPVPKCLHTCNDDSLDVNERPVFQNRSNVSPIVHGDEDSSRSRIMEAVFYTRLTHGRSINHGQKIRDICVPPAKASTCLTLTQRTGSKLLYLTVRCMNFLLPQHPAGSSTVISCTPTTSPFREETSRPCPWHTSSTTLTHRSTDQWTS